MALAVMRCRQHREAIWRRKCHEARAFLRRLRTASKRRAAMDHRTGTSRRLARCRPARGEKARQVGRRPACQEEGSASRPPPSVPGGGSAGQLPPSAPAPPAESGARRDCFAPTQDTFVCVERELGDPIKRRDVTPRDHGAPIAVATARRSQGAPARGPGAGGPARGTCRARRLRRRRTTRKLRSA